MRSLRFFALWSALSLLSGAVMGAAPLQISVSGQFGSSVTPTQLAGPNEPWSLSFTVDSNPVASNVDQLGFDAPFTGFTYSLNNAVVAASPASIRFYTANNLGLFTTFFGPESGFSNGAPIPEFSFQGTQLFSGSTASPTLLPGTYTVNEFIYSDASNYDDHLPANLTLTVANVNVPEPAPLAALLLGLGLIGCNQVHRFRCQR